MPILFIAGPDRAGKSTLVDALRQRGLTANRHWGPINSLYDYLPAVTSDIREPHTVVHDRLYPCEYVYSTLLRRPRESTDDPWYPEWRVGRALRANSSGVILLGPKPETIAQRHFDEDAAKGIHHPNPDVAFEGYRQFADQLQHLYRAFHARYPHYLLRNEANDELADYLADYAHSLSKHQIPPAHLSPYIVGPTASPLLIIGSRRNTKRSPEHSLPFDDNQHTRFARMLGDSAFNCRWSTALECPSAAYRQHPYILAVGTTAFRAARLHAGKDQIIMQSPHPHKVEQNHLLANGPHPATVYKPYIALIKGALGEPGGLNPSIFAPKIDKE